MSEFKKIYKQFLDRFKGSGIELKEEGVCVEEAAMQIASDTMKGYGEFEKKDIVKYMKSIGVSDAQGRLADDIYNAMLK